MNDSELPVHWRFAAGQAFAGLRELVRSFDFLRLANGHTYAGIEPGYLVEVIDGFLGEPDGVVFGGDRINLQDLRKLLVEKIQPGHRLGLEAGRRHWQEGDRAYGKLSTDELHQVALDFAPADEMLRGWFAEGFCFAYCFEEMESLRSGASG
jgi:hypothetical protein